MACARRIAPAQVPQTGLVLVNSLSGCRSPPDLARNAIVVDSAERQNRVIIWTPSHLPPPGIIRPSHFSRSSGVRTRRGQTFIGDDILRRAVSCSAKAPWRADMLCQWCLLVDEELILAQYADDHLALHWRCQVNLSRWESKHPQREFTGGGRNNPTDSTSGQRKVPWETYSDD